MKKKYDKLYKKLQKEMYEHFSFCRYCSVDKDSDPDKIIFRAGCEIGERLITLWNKMDEEVAELEAEGKK